METLVIVIVIFLYFLPAVIAEARHHKESACIFVLNMFLGRTLLGWVISLIRALSSNVKKPLGE